MKAMGLLLHTFSEILSNDNNSNDSIPAVTVVTLMVILVIEQPSDK